MQHTCVTSPMVSTRARSRCITSRDATTTALPLSIAAATSPGYKSNVAFDAKHTREFSDNSSTRAFAAPYAIARACVFAIAFNPPPVVPDVNDTNHSSASDSVIRSSSRPDVDAVLDGALTSITSTSSSITRRRTSTTPSSDPSVSAVVVAPVAAAAAATRSTGHARASTLTIARPTFPHASKHTRAYVQPAHALRTRPPRRESIPARASTRALSSSQHTGLRVRACAASSSAMSTHATSLGRSRACRARWTCARAEVGGDMGHRGERRRVKRLSSLTFLKAKRAVGSRAGRER